MGNDDFADFVGGVKLKEIDWLTTKIYYVIYKPGDNPKEIGKLATLLASAIREETGKKVTAKSAMPLRLEYQSKDKWMDDCCRVEGFNMAIEKMNKSLGIEEAK